MPPYYIDPNAPLFELPSLEGVGGKWKEILARLGEGFEKVKEEEAQGRVESPGSPILSRLGSLLKMFTQVGEEADPKGLSGMITPLMTKGALAKELTRVPLKEWGKGTPTAKAELEEALQLVKGIPRRTLKDLEDVMWTPGEAEKWWGGAPKVSTQGQYFSGPNIDPIVQLRTRAQDPTFVGGLPDTVKHETSHQSVLRVLERLADRFGMKEVPPTSGTAWPTRYQRLEELLEPGVLEGATTYVGEQAIPRKAGLPPGLPRFGHGEEQRAVYDELMRMPSQRNPYWNMAKYLEEKATKAYLGGGAIAPGYLLRKGRGTLRPQLKGKGAQ